MTDHFRWPLMLVIASGLAAAIWAIGSVGLLTMAHAAAAIGLIHFIGFCLLSMTLYALLGAAWWAAMPAQPASQIPLFAWARIVREGASDLLPFSQLGGLAVGTRTLIAAGLPPPRVFAATLVDLSTELASQIVFTVFGLLALGSVVSGAQAAMAPLAWIGAGVTMVSSTGFVLFQRPMLRIAAGFARRFKNPPPFERIEAQLRATYRRGAWVALSFLLNTGAWLLAAVIGAVALWLIGSPLPLWRVAALESLIFALRAAAFVVPGGLGVQEAGYLLLGPLFGLPASAAVALSLVKRARDVSIGLPALLIWQWAEMVPRSVPEA